MLNVYLVQLSHVTVIKFKVGKNQFINNASTLDCYLISQKELIVDSVAKILHSTLRFHLRNLIDIF